MIYSLFQATESIITYYEIFNGKFLSSPVFEECIKTILILPLLTFFQIKLNNTVHEIFKIYFSFKRTETNIFLNDLMKKKI